MSGKVDNKEDYKSFYFTSLINLLSDVDLNHGKDSDKPSIPHSKKPSSKKYELKLRSELGSKVPLPVDPHFLTGKKEWGRKSLAHNITSQREYEKNVEAYDREMKKAMQQLKSSKAYHTKMLKQMQERQLEIMKKKDQERLLVQAQYMYDNTPVLTSKRMCAACTRKPKSAKANHYVSIDGLLRPDANSMRCHRMTFTAYEHRHQPPRPFLKPPSSPISVTRHVPKIVCFENIRLPSRCPSRSSTPCSVRLFDSSLIPDNERIKSDSVV